MSALYIRDASGNFVSIPTIRGADGKTAYQYAQDGGYTGTEEEFAAKLAEESYVLPTASETVKGGVKVGNGLVMDGEALGVKPEGEYKLIKTITLTAEQNGITEIVERYSPGYDGIMVTIIGATEDKARTIYIGVGASWTMRSTGYTLQIKDVARFVFKKVNGIWDIYGYAGSSSGFSTMVGQVSANNISSTDSAGEGISNYFPNIGFVRIYTFDATGLIEGTTVNIYGMRDGE